MTAISRHTNSCPPLRCSSSGHKLPGPAILSQHLPGNWLSLKAMKANIWSLILYFTGLHLATPSAVQRRATARGKGTALSPSKPVAAGRSRQKAVGNIWNWCLKCKFSSGLSTSSASPTGSGTHNCFLPISSYHDFHPSDSFSPLGSFTHLWVFYDTRTKRCSISNKTHRSPSHRQLQDPLALTDNPQYCGKGCFQISCWKSSSKVAAEFKSHTN